LSEVAADARECPVTARKPLHDTWVQLIRKVAVGWLADARGVTLERDRTGYRKRGALPLATCLRQPVAGGQKRRTDGSTSSAASTSPLSRTNHGAGSAIAIARSLSRLSMIFLVIDQVLEAGLVNGGRCPRRINRTMLYTSSPISSTKAPYTFITSGPCLAAYLSNSSVSPSISSLASVLATSG